MANKANPTDAELDQAVTGGAISQASPVQRMLIAMASEAEAEEAGFKGDDLIAMIDAATEDELWESDERPPLNAQHLSGCVLDLIDVSVRYSRSGSEIDSMFKAAGKTMYLMVTAVRVTDASDKGNLIKLPKVGEVFQFNTSARYLATKIWQFYVRGAIDQDQGNKLRCQIRETDLGDGQAVLKLRPAATSTVG